MPCLVRSFLHLNAVTKEITGIKLKITHVSCGYAHTLFVDEKTDVWSVGCGIYGQLGHGDIKNCRSPKQIAIFKALQISKVAAGAKHSLAITANEGDLYSWGMGDQGRLGLNNEVGVPSPTQIRSKELQPLVFIKISAGESHSAAITTDGAVYTWGSGAFGKLGHNSLDNVLLPTLVQALSTTAISSVECGPFHTIFLSDAAEGDSGAGIVFACGSDQYGQLGNGGNDNILNTDNNNNNNNNNGVEKKSAFSENSEVESVSAPQAAGGPMTARVITQVSAGPFHNIASAIDGTLWGWGFSGHGRLTLEAFKNVQNPQYLDALANVPASGNVAGQIGYQKNDDVDDDGNDNNNTNSKKNNQGGRNAKGLIQSLNQRLVRQIACGAQHSLALCVGGQIYGWGENDCGQLGLNHQIDQYFPEVVTDNIAHLTIIGIAAGSQHSLGWTKDAGVFSWGRGTEGQLGYGTRKNDDEQEVIVGEETWKPQKMRTAGGGRRDTCAENARTMRKISGYYILSSCRKENAAQLP